MKKLYIFGGSFDPFHKAHKELVEQFDDEVLIIPTYNPFKDNCLFSLKERILMIKKIKFKNNSKVVDFTLENPEHYMFMANIINRLSYEYPDSDINLIMGYDTYREIYKWKNIDTIQNDITCLVFNRDNKKRELQKGIKTQFLDKDINNLSSTEIRELINSNNLSEISKLCPEEILPDILSKAG